MLGRFPWLLDFPTPAPLPDPTTSRPHTLPRNGFVLPDVSLRASNARALPAYMRFARTCLHKGPSTSHGKSLAQCRQPFPDTACGMRRANLPAVLPPERLPARSRVVFALPPPSPTIR